MQAKANLNRILFAIPIGFVPGPAFWTRDSGLVVLALREMGYDAWLVALGNETTVTEGMPVLCVSLDDLTSADWWKAQRPDAVVLNTWSAPRYDPVRRAALASGARVVERLDTSGNRSVRLFPRACYVQTWGGNRDRLPKYARWLAHPLTAVQLGLRYCFPQLLDARMAASMTKTHGVAAESPIAAERIRRTIETSTGGSHPVAMIPHPVNDSVIHYGGERKENRIISVGRWDTAQKDFPLMIKVLEGFLRRHPDWLASVVGVGVPDRFLAPGGDTEKWLKRVSFHKKLTHDQLTVEYSRSRIYLMVSRYESFCIAAAEALCCGCSVVGSVDVPSSFLFAEHDSGTVSPKRTLDSFLATLDQEVEFWAQDKRQPKAIAASAQARMGSRAVAEATLNLLRQVGPPEVAVA